MPKHTFCKETRKVYVICVIFTQLIWKFQNLLFSLRRNYAITNENISHYENDKEPQHLAS